MDQADVRQRVAWYVATEVVGADAKDEAREGFAKILIWQHDQGRINLDGDIDVAVAKAQRAWELLCT